MDRTEIRRRALHAAAHITFVATAGCSSAAVGPADQPIAASTKEEVDVTAPEASSTAVAAQPAPEPRSNVKVGDGSDKACTDAAASAPPGEAFPPDVDSCCKTVIQNAEVARASGQPRPPGMWSCCKANYDSPMCQAWGPPAPPRTRRLAAVDRARIAARWGVGSRGGPRDLASARWA